MKDLHSHWIARTLFINGGDSSRKLLLALFALLSSCLAFGDIYVSSTGTGTACTSGSPCSVSQGLSNYASGTSGIIHFANGSYSAIDINKSGGSTSSRLVVQCDNGASAATAAIGKCVLTDHISVGLNGNGGNNIDIVGFDVGNNAGLNTGIIAYCGLISGSTCGTGNSVHIIGNYVHDLASNVWNDAHTVIGCPQTGAIAAGRTGFLQTDIQIHRNVIKNYGAGYPGTGCNVAQGIYTTGPAIIQDNIVINVPTGSIQLASSCGSVVSNNVTIGAHEGLILEDSANNICPGGAAGHNTIANNYFAHNVNAAIFYLGGRSECTSSTPNLFSHNISDGVVSDFSVGPFSCDTVSPNSLVHQAGASFFVNYQTNGSGDYHLKAGSAGIGSGSIACVAGGTSPCTRTIDFAGTVRAVPVSIGVYEPTQSASLPNAPTGLTARVQ